jgi:hypothetical protein
MSSIQDAIDAINVLLRAVSGIRVVPDDPPDSMNIYPFAVVYPGSGTWDQGVPGERLGLCSLIVELHVARRDLPTAVQHALTFADTVPDALMADPTLTGSVSTYGVIEWTFGPLAWGDTPTIGWRYTLTNVKIREDIA